MSRKSLRGLAERRAANSASGVARASALGDPDLAFRRAAWSLKTRSDPGEGERRASGRPGRFEEKGRNEDLESLPSLRLGPSPFVQVPPGLPVSSGPLETNLLSTHPPHLTPTLSQPHGRSPCHLDKKVDPRVNEVGQVFRTEPESVSRRVLSFTHTVPLCLWVILCLSLLKYTLPFLC